MPAQIRVQREDEYSSFLVGTIELLLVELKEQVGRRHVAFGAKIWRLGQRPVDGQLDDAGVLAVGENLERNLGVLQARIVDESLLSDQVHRPLAEGPRGRAISGRLLVGQ